MRPRKGISRRDTRRAQRRTHRAKEFTVLVNRIMNEQPGVTREYAREVARLQLVLREVLS